jgi:DNA polymerase-3 subunit delta
MAQKKKTDDAEYTALKAALRAKQPERLYLFYGEEAYLRDYYLGQLRSQMAEGPAAEFNTHQFDGRTLDLDELRDAVEALPMMAERSLVEVDDYDLFGAGESAREQIVELISDLPEHICLVFVFDTVAYKPDGRLKKLTAALKQNAHVVEFAKQSQRDLSTWVVRHFRTAGKQIDTKLADYLVFLTDGTMTALSSEISKIAAFATGDVIQKTDIDMVVEKSLDAQVFDITDAMAQHDFNGALTKLSEVLAMQSEPISVLAAIGSNIRRMRAAQVLSSRGKGADALAKLCGIHPYAAEKNVSAARRFSRAWCDMAVCACMETDYQLKSSADDAERLLELLIVRLAQEARRD